jgi:hypothetical protein
MNNKLLLLEKGMRALKGAKYKGDKNEYIYKILYKDKLNVTCRVKYKSNLKWDPISETYNRTTVRWYKIIPISKALTIFGEAIFNKTFEGSDYEGVYSFYDELKD